MSILITGGCGFIGTNLIKKIKKKYNDIIIVDNETLGKKKNLKNYNVKFYKIDITNYPKLKNVFKKHKIKYIVHLAAHTRVLESINNPFKNTSNISNSSNICKIEEINILPGEELLLQCE